MFLRHRVMTLVINDNICAQNHGVGASQNSLYHYEYGGVLQSEWMHDPGIVFVRCWESGVPMRGTPVPTPSSWHPSFVPPSWPGS